jgi:hypothetical protein
MRAKNNSAKLVMILSALLMMACLLPGMVPLKSQPKGPVPYMEKDANAVIKVLSGKDWHYLQALAKEQYTDADYAKPGTLTYTVSITDDQPVYFNYGWCAKDDAILQQNMQHINVKLYFNGDELGKDVVQNLSYKSADNMSCADFGVLTSEWTDGEYKLKAVATFDQKLNDGISDYDPGDYIFEYNVTVKKQKGGATGLLPELVYKPVL